MALRFLPLKFLQLRSGVILGCELLRGQGFPDNLNVSGSVMTSADHEIVIPEVPDSWTWTWIWSLYVCVPSCTVFQFQGLPLSATL